MLRQVARLIVFGPLMLAGCADAGNFNEADMQGPNADLRGAWINETSGTIVFITQDGDSVTVTSPGLRTKTSKGTVKGRVWVSDDRHSAMTVSPDGNQAESNYRGSSDPHANAKLRRVLLGASSSHPKASKYPLLSGTVVCRLPVAANGRPVLERLEKTSPGSVRECWVTLRHVTDQKGNVSVLYVAAPLDPPTALAYLDPRNSSTILTTIEMNAIHRARDTSPMSKMQAGAIGDAPYYWVIAPAWDEGTPGAFLVAECYAADLSHSFLGIGGGEGPKREGFLLTFTVAGGPGEAAGLKAGDLVISIAGMNVNSLEDVRTVTAGLKVGEQAKVRFQRDGAEKLVTLKAAARPVTNAPIDMLTVARIPPGQNPNPTPGYLHRSDKLVRVSITLLGPDYSTKIETVEDKEPALESFLVAKETAIPEGRWRTGVLLMIKNRSLPKLVAEGSTADLKALVEKLEKLVLDLNHENELAKDAAQKELEANRSADFWREMAIVYKERIEVLKPILAAIKEEVANRGK